jgi:thymidylate synthase (FAD)
MVKLIAISKPVGELSNLTADELCSYVARVSNPSNQMNTETAPKLLKYCAEHGHFSVFEHVSITMEIKTSRAIAAQILRHRSFTFQEFSQRYAKATNFVEYPARRQDLKNRQNSIDDLSEKDQAWFSWAQQQVNSIAKTLYDEALASGIAKECARFLLPLSTETTLYMTGSLRSWLHYVKLRADASTQLEHREIAEACKAVLKEHCPSVSEAMGW